MDLAAGRYWTEVVGNPERLDGMGGDIDVFAAWVKTSGARIIESRLTPAKPLAWGDVEPAHLKTTFEVSRVTPWADALKPPLAGAAPATSAKSPGVSLPGPILPTEQTVKEGISALTWIAIGAGAILVFMMLRQTSSPTIRIQGAKT